MNTHAIWAWFLLAAAILIQMIPMTSRLFFISALMGPILTLAAALMLPLPGHLLLLGAGLALAGLVSSRGVIPGGIVPLLLTVLPATLLLLGFLALNRWVLHRTAPFWTLLLFALGTMALDYLSTRGPFGSFASLANHLLPVRPLAQWASLGGLAAVVFLASLIQGAVALGLAAGMPRFLAAAGIIVVTVITGGLLLNRRHGADSPPLVRAAGVYPDEAVWNAAITPLLADPAGSSDEPWKGITAALIRDTETVLAEGARLVVWPEGATALTAAEETAVLAWAGETARSHNAVLIPSYILRHPPEDGPAEIGLQNLALVVDGSGEVLVRHEKVRLVPGEERFFRPAPEREAVSLPTVETVLGSLTLGICYDADFPSLVRRPAEDMSRLLVIPASDWKAITPYHTDIAAYRGIENGLTVLRVAKAGDSAAFNSRGRLLGRREGFADPASPFFRVDIPFGAEK